ncbi:MAG: hypothetical protein H6744_03720 [Deltaproteobacteria bacterium]|nr:hypothetical protein [Deltaproteobacteria bacterium]MCB9785785.1 hypothetical protein [Deltaproteobacteria bacterium]
MKAAAAIGLAVACWLVAPCAAAAELVFADPAGDDTGPGTYVYPSDVAYLPGSFDLRRVELRDVGDQVEVRVTLGAEIQDPWDSRAWDGNGFSLQMIQIYLDTAPGDGVRDALPGIDASFAADDAWDRVVLIAPQGVRRLREEVARKAPGLRDRIVLPSKVSVDGRALLVRVPRKALGGGVSARWGVQVLVCGDDPFVGEGNLLVRPVNALAGQHRFGGGVDAACEPQVLDLLAAPAVGGAAEVAAQRAMLAYACAAGGAEARSAVLTMVRQQASVPKGR